MDSHPEGTVRESVGSETWKKFWARFRRMSWMAPGRSGADRGNRPLRSVEITNDHMNRLVMGTQHAWLGEGELSRISLASTEPTRYRRRASTTASSAKSNRQPEQRRRSGSTSQRLRPF